MPDAGRDPTSRHSAPTAEARRGDAPPEQRPAARTATGPRAAGRRAAVVLAAGLALYAVLALTSMRRESSTFDESVNLPPGYAALALGDYWIDPFHPPLVRTLAALPLLALDVELDRDHPTLRKRRIWGFGHQFLYRWNDAERLLTWGRLPVMGLALALAAAVFLFTRRHWGLPAAAFALLFCVLDPGMLTHGRAITTDLGVTLFLFLAVVAFERLTAGATWPRVFAAGAALGAALASKFSGVLLLPMLGALALVVALAPAPLPLTLGREARTVATRGRRLLVLAGLLVAMGLVAAAVVWAAHGFHSAPNTGAAGAAAVFPWSAVALESPLAQGAITFARDWSLLPQPWLYGLSHLLAGGHGGVAFLLGQESAAGWWYYFPVTFALKTPLPLLLLLGVALYRLPRQRDRRLEAFVWLPPLLYLGAAMVQHVNLGNRHLLPIYPFLFVAAGRAAAELWAAGAEPGPRWWRSDRRRLVAVLTGWLAVSTLSTWPHFITYFNELAGGRERGWRRLVDSNFDWGQGLVGLRQWMEERGVDRVTLCYFGSADPGYYGIAGDRLPGFLPPPRERTVRAVRRGDLMAVSATHLQGVYLDDTIDPLMDRLRGRDPLAVVGGSIFVYRMSFDWAAEKPRGRRQREGRHERPGAARRRASPAPDP